MSLQELLAALPAAHKKHLDPAGPAPGRMMAAKGLAPLPPRELVLVLAGLTFDADAKLAEAARGTLAKLPSKMFATALAGELPTAALAVIADAATGREELLEPIALNKGTPDEVVARVARAASERLGEIIASNQERFLRSRDIVDALRGNANVLRSTVDRVFDFLAREGVVYEDMHECAEALARLSPTETEAAAAKVELPTEVQQLLHDPAADPQKQVEDEQRAEAVATALEEAKAPEKEAERIPMLKLVNSLNIAQRIALAVRGNKEARSILIRDSNKMVASATIRSPRITEQEIVSAANSRSIVEDVIRIIANSKEMTRSYAVKLALVGNPKTPLTTSMRMLTLLRDNDVRNLAKSKNVPAAIATQARRLVQARNQK